MKSNERGQRFPRRFLRAAKVIAASLLMVCLAVVTTFHVARFKSFTDFAIVNRWTGSRCGIAWNQLTPVCSDTIADFVDLPFMRIFAAEVEVSAWNDLQLHEVNLTPRKCAALRVRHALSASGIETDAGLETQTIWLSDGGVYTVASTGLTRGNTANVCVGISKDDGSLRITLQVHNAHRIVYTTAFLMPVTPRRRWWWQNLSPTSRG